jgi:hypothetical protein
MTLELKPLPGQADLNRAKPQAPLIVAPERATLGQRTLSHLLTAVAWAAYAWLIAPLLTSIAWLLGLRHACLEMDENAEPTGFRATLEPPKPLRRVMK